MHNRNVLVCDDHPIFRSGVVVCLNEIENISVVAQASDVTSAIAKLEIYEPDTLVTDLSMPGQNGFDLLKWTIGNQPSVQVFVLSMHTELAFVRKAKELGAAGFLAKEDAETELLDAFSQSSSGFYTSQSIGRTSQDQFSDLNANTMEIEALKYISTAEHRVLNLLADSMTNKAIAERLRISSRTVEAHRHRIAGKLDLKGPNKLIEFAIKNKSHIQNYS